MEEGEPAPRWRQYKGQPAGLLDVVLFLKVPGHREPQSLANRVSWPPHKWLHREHREHCWCPIRPPFLGQRTHAPAAECGC